MSGHGRQIGGLRPEMGEGFAQLKCDACSATWTGPPNEPCEYCAPDAHDRRMAAERRRVELAEQLERERTP
jgi:hypothetical protein